MPKLLPAAAACIAVLTFGMLASGCAQRTAPVEIPTRSDDPTTLPRPTADDAQRWADTVIPENALGGATWTQREAGVLEPGREPLITVAADEAPATVTIACVSGGGDDLAFTVVAGGATLDRGDVRCAAVDDDAEPLSIPDVPADATVELEAGATGLFVYTVSPNRDPAR
ncbi:hypothetical protein [Microbacterium sp. cf332]|uniref:hypothetical protein n=1 Tax=Microbacterium sp. cf332 TaxID=1761804 RepID=UPI000887A2BF|nr:hypothetical protein [Microbacterium sp. cf332]SDQ66192.1 hypothetical protein SAMN04487847_2270 [Microbacterium sp. cf332]